MEYQFTRRDNAKPVAHFLMGAEAFGRWFSDELGANQLLVKQILDIIQQLEQRQLSEYQLVGSEFVLHLATDEVEVTGKELLSDFTDELPEDIDLYQQEQQAGCGLEDFKQVLLSWQQFIES
ncbi:YacL family protein [Neptunicella sp. SCSIO 80796]|uniref:UPF0231 family protein n=1 Tax=Neptunicella plasticusilytica TaxID=3117012 RepID=UPI003A4E3016